MLDVYKRQSMDSSMYVMYLFDETDINTYIQKLKDERFVVGLVYIDNYEEALDVYKRQSQLRL